MPETDPKQSDASAEADGQTDVNLAETLDLKVQRVESAAAVDAAPPPVSDVRLVHAGEDSIHLLDQTHALLRNRLRAAALVLSAMMGFAFLRGVFHPESQHALYRFASLFVVAGSCTVLFGVE